MMLKLKHIKDTHCSTCGAEIVRVERNQRHTNGEYNETVAFKCGAALHYSPNFNRVRETRRCHRNPTQIVVDTFYDILEKKLISASNKVLANYPLPAEDDRLMRELESSIKRIRVDINSAIGYAIMRGKL
jgi:hypothetical protein